MANRFAAWMQASGRWRRQRSWTASGAMAKATAHRGSVTWPGAKTNFAHRIDMWNDDGETIVEQLAGIDDCELAMAAYQFAVERWPKTTITLRQRARVIKDSRKRHALSMKGGHRESVAVSAVEPGARGSCQAGAIHA